MSELPRGPLKLKALLISNDRGKTWTIIQRHYLVNVETDQFLDVEMLGVRLATMKGDEDHDYDKRQTSAD